MGKNFSLIAIAVLPVGGSRFILFAVTFLVSFLYMFLARLGLFCLFFIGVANFIVPYMLDLALVSSSIRDSASTYWFLG